MNTLRGIKRQADEARAELDMLNGVDTRNATYTVTLHWFKPTREKGHTTITHTGTIADAIKAAERAYKEDDHGLRILTETSENIQASYSVTVRVGYQEYSVPSEYFERYKEKEAPKTS